MSLRPSALSTDSEAIAEMLKPPLSSPAVSQLVRLPVLAGKLSDTSVFHLYVRSKEETQSRFQG